MRSSLYVRCFRVPRWPIRKWACFRSYTGNRLLEPEIAIVPCRNNGVITLDIYKPTLQPTSKNADEAESILLYLPRGPIFQLEPPPLSSKSWASDGAVAAGLAQASGLTVVQINYRLDHEHRFPTPIHDVITGYDWVLKNFANNKEEFEEADTNEQSSTARRDSAISQTRIGVCGELLGGTLALSLALTECKLPNSETATSTASWGCDDASHAASGRVVAVATNNAIVDWVPPMEKDPLSSKKPKRVSTVKAALTKAVSSADSPEDRQEHHINDILSSESLWKAKDALFYPTRTADCFDPFVSPVLFLRTPGVASGENFDAGDSINNLDLIEKKSPPATSPNSGTETEKAANETADDTVVIPWLEDLEPSNPSNESTSSFKRRKPYKPRKLPRKYPPLSMLPVAFPVVQLGVETGSILHEQNVEMAALLQRALGRFEFPGKYAAVGSKKSRVQNTTLHQNGKDTNTLPLHFNLRSHVSEEEAEHQYMEEYIQQRVQLNLRGNGVGLWCSPRGTDQETNGGNMWGEEIRKVGVWMGDMLRKKTVSH